MEVPGYRRPDRAMPFACEAALLDKRRLITLSTLEYGLPLGLATADDTIAVGAVGDPRCSVYSSYAFDALLQEMDPPTPTIDAYFLPHLPFRMLRCSSTCSSPAMRGFVYATTPFSV